jgi:hypothetical protein
VRGRANLGAPGLVITGIASAETVRGVGEGWMSFLKKLLGRAPVEPPVRVRVCIECGMPVEKHATWCAIFRTQQEMDQKRNASGAS